jgi:hypothetical protein
MRPNAQIWIMDYLPFCSLQQQDQLRSERSSAILHVNYYAKQHKNVNELVVVHGLSVIRCTCSSTCFFMSNIPVTKIIYPLT